MKIDTPTYFELTPAQQASVPNNGCGKECANYIRIDWGDRTSIDVFSDAMEPEDATFSRDLSWVIAAITKAYAKSQGDA